MAAYGSTSPRDVHPRYSELSFPAFVRAKTLLGTRQCFSGSPKSASNRMERAALRPAAGSRWDAPFDQATTNRYPRSSSVRLNRWPYRRCQVPDSRSARSLERPTSRPPIREKTEMAERAPASR